MQEIDSEGLETSPSESKSLVLPLHYESKKFGESGGIRIPDLGSRNPLL